MKTCMVCNEEIKEGETFQTFPGNCIDDYVHTNNETDDEPSCDESLDDLEDIDVPGEWDE